MLHSDQQRFAPGSTVGARVFSRALVSLILHAFHISYIFAARKALTLTVTFEKQTVPYPGYQIISFKTASNSHESVSREDLDWGRIHEILRKIYPKI